MALSSVSFIRVFTITLIGVVFITVGAFEFKEYIASASFLDNIYGYAWSSNIGWISFNDINQGSGGGNYGVRADSNGNLAGYAWSPNIGWISFNAGDVVGCPGTAGNTTCAPKLNLVTKEVSGWARACAGTVSKDCAGGDRTDGWDGWISLKGQSPAYGVSTTQTQPYLWQGWAWGSEVVGWISFAGSLGGGGGPRDYGVVGPDNSIQMIVNVTASPNPVKINSSATWSAVVSGGTGPYTYSWNGDEGLSGNTPTVSKSYKTVGQKAGTVTVSDSGSPKQTKSASFTLTVDLFGRVKIKEIQP